LVSVITVLIVAGVIWVSLTTLWLWRHQERVVFQPPTDAPEAPAPARRVAYAAADGHQLFGYVLDAPAGAASGRRVVMAFHGNADLSAWIAPWAHELSKRAGVTVFVPEYRGYGGFGCARRVGIRA
jgi:dipeptidyl aminopeptidase/acylaminoacyl peptidase